MNITEKFLLFPGYAVVNFMIFFPMVLLYCCNCNYENSNCAPSSCGDIHNIRYPFRLKTDPEGCGVADYELSCEENNNKNSSVTVLYLKGGKFYVRAINYDNYTIRLVDAGVDIDDDCSSFPHFPLSYNSFMSDDDPYTTYRYNCRRSMGYLSLLDLAERIKIIECEDEVDTYNYYLVANPCSTNNGSDDHPKFYTYAYIGEGMTVSNLSVGCRVSMVSLLSPPARDFKDKVNEEMAFGFELSWLNFYCGNCSDPSLVCCIDEITNHVIGCSPYSDRTTGPFYALKGLFEETCNAIHDWYMYTLHLFGGHLTRIRACSLLKDGYGYGYIWLWLWFSRWQLLVCG